MKSTAQILIILISILSCTNSKPKIVLSEREKLEEGVKEELSTYSEQIALLSAIKNIPYDSLSRILTDYYFATFDYRNSTDSLKFYTEKAINDISDKYHISKRRAASLIFSFKYEMLTNEEIADKELEKREDEQQEPPEDPR